MEAGDPGSSKYNSAICPTDRFNSRYAESYRGSPAMATATLISPTSAYHPPPHHLHQHPYPSSYSPSTNYAPDHTPPIPHPPPTRMQPPHSHPPPPGVKLLHPQPPPPPPSGPNTSNIMSPVDSRRTSDEPHPNRQSLPSLQEVLDGSNAERHSGAYANGPSAPRSRPPPPPVTGLPSPYTSAPSRPFSDAPLERRTPPQPAHQPRLSEGFGRPTMTPINTSIGPSMGPYSGQQHQQQQQHRIPHPPPPLGGLQDRPEMDPRLSDGHRQANRGPSIPHPPPPIPQLHQPPTPSPSQPAQGLYPQTGRLPPGQFPLAGQFPSSPHSQSGTSLPSPYESHGRPTYFENDRRRAPKAEYDPRDHMLVIEDYSEALSMMSQGARTVLDFSRGYEHNLQNEQANGGRLHPQRLPTERECQKLFESTDLMLHYIGRVRDMVQQNRIYHERLQERGARNGYDDDSNMYQDGIKPYGDNHKKSARRGRAAPPGRCHSCNRVDTPEWRRGPDGARTLCNACGLHYAKLERRKATEAKMVQRTMSQT